MLSYFVKILDIDLFKFSVFLSFVALLLFLCGLYFLIYYCLKDKLIAGLITFFSIFSVHALGGSVFGIQALGFLPRDLALALSMYILLLYFYAINRQSNFYALSAFFISGIFSNFYPLLFFQLVLTLLCSEIVRTRSLRFINVWCFFGFLIGALPTVIDILYKSTQAAPIDIEIMRSFYKYMIADFSLDTFRHYLRRFIIYGFLVTAIIFLVIRNADNSEKKKIHPWIAIAISSFILSVIGVYLESTTVFTKYMMSRISLWFILSSMVIISFGIRLFMNKFSEKKSIILTAAVVSAIFCLQSNIPTAYRFLRNTYINRNQTREFHAAIEKLKELTTKDDLIIAPSDEYNDLAASVRTYSLRPIYICYKYGGISVMDGTIAREWIEKYQNLQDVFKDKDPKKLIAFMKSNEISYALIPSWYYRDSLASIRRYIAADTGGYLIINCRDSLLGNIRVPITKRKC
jgi:hypothetical protein